MRREILSPLGGFFAGFVVAAIVFWQPAETPTSAPQPIASEAVSSPETAPPSGGNHPRRRLVVATQEDAGVAPLAEGGPKPKGAAEVFHEALATLKDMDVNRRQTAIAALVKQLRAAGPEGLQVLRDYFRAGQDVKFQNGYTMVNGVPMQSLRLMLLNALGDWPGNEGSELSHEILRTTSRISEASLAISQMEKSAPGVYRVEAIQTLLKLAAKFDTKDAAENGGTVLFDVMKKLKAAELLPAAEAVVSKNPWVVQPFAASLDALPAAVRAPALERLFANEAVTKNLATNPWVMQSLNYAEPVIAQNAAQIFASNPDKKYRETFLQGIAQPGNSGGDTTAERVVKLQARGAFLDTIAPQCNTPVLQERLQDAREALQRAIENPDDNGLTKRGAGTLILSGANTFIGGATINTSGSIQITTTVDKK